MKSTTRIVAALAAIALLAGCQSSTESTASEGTTQLAEAGALPVTVDHAYGSTTIETGSYFTIVLATVDHARRASAMSASVSPRV